MSKLKLEGLLPSQLKSMIENNYYKSCIEYRERLSDEAINSRLQELIGEIKEVEADAVQQERYDIAIVCRDMSLELIENLDLCISI